MIRNRKGIQQVVDFGGMVFKGGVSPSDIDCVISKPKGMIIVEVKADGAPLPAGQRRTFQEMNLAYMKAGLKFICFIATHKSVDYGDVMLRDCLVRSYLFNGRWVEMKGERNVGAEVARFYDKYLA